MRQSSLRLSLAIHIIVFLEILVLHKTLRRIQCSVTIIDRYLDVAQKYFQAYVPHFLS